jgi:hypothetical protein
LGLALIPIIAPIFFGPKHIKIYIHDNNFEDKLESFSQTHLQWATLMKEHILQQENNGKDVDTIVERLFGKVCSRAPSKNSKFASAGFLEAQIPDSSLFPIYNSPKTNGRIIRASCVSFLLDIQAPTVSPVLRHQALLALWPLQLLPLHPPST